MTECGRLASLSGNHAVTPCASSSKLAVYLTQPATCIFHLKLMAAHTRRNTDKVTHLDRLWSRRLFLHHHPPPPPYPPPACPIAPTHRLLSWRSRPSLSKHTNLTFRIITRHLVENWDACYWVYLVPGVCRYLSELSSGVLLWAHLSPKHLSRPLLKRELVVTGRFAQVTCSCSMKRPFFSLNGL